MPKNPFIEQRDYVKKQKRSTYDLSFQNNLSLKMGYLVPVLCKEGTPGDSFRINAAAFLRAFPTVFPVQTPVRMNLHFFRCYNRPAWKNFTDFIYGNREDLVHPYLDGNTLSRDGSISSLFDYMGVPVSAHGVTDPSVELSSTGRAVGFQNSISVMSNTYYDGKNPQLTGTTSVTPTESDDNVIYSLSQDYNYYISLNSRDDIPVSALFQYKSIDIQVQSIIPFWSQMGSSITRVAFYVQPFISYETSSGSTTLFGPISSVLGPSVGNVSTATNSPLLSFPMENIKNLVQGAYSDMDTSAENYPFFKWLASGVKPDDYRSGGVVKFRFYFTLPNSTGGVQVSPGIAFKAGHFGSLVPIGSGENILSEGANNPYVDDIHINALPFRHYEMIYNSFYRDDINDPLFVNGERQFNNFCPNDGDGKDSYPYTLHQRNWEKDFLTSAYPSPQQGLAPLVGITSRGRMTFQRANGELAEVQAIFAEDNETLQSFEMTREVASDPVLRASVMDIVSSGISINDLREVGAYQRWKEKNQRRSYRFRDQVYSHTGIKIDYDELDMPTFLGGYSRVVNTTQINQTVDGGSTSPLGSFAGQLSFFNKMEHSVNCFFQEHGFLIGILCIVPTPAYSQLLPKHFLKENALDYYNEEFARIGMQPIMYREVCPMQIANQVSSKTYTDTFGYQRPWYDLIASVDEVHGVLRTSMRDMVMNRTFDNVPELSPDFLHIDPQQLNQVFSYTDPSEDTFFGQIVFDITKRTTIPRSGVPMLNC